VEGRREGRPAEVERHRGLARPHGASSWGKRASSGSRRADAWRPKRSSRADRRRRQPMNDAWRRTRRRAAEEARRRSDEDERRVWSRCKRTDDRTASRSERRGRQARGQERRVEAEGDAAWADGAGG
jgi:hypothetical protein